MAIGKEAADTIRKLNAELLKGTYHLCPSCNRAYECPAKRDFSGSCRLSDYPCPECVKLAPTTPAAEVAHTRITCEECKPIDEGRAVLFCQQHQQMHRAYDANQETIRRLVEVIRIAGLRLCPLVRPGDELGPIRDDLHAAFIAAALKETNHD